MATLGIADYVLRQLADDLRELGCTVKVANDWRWKHADLEKAKEAAHRIVNALVQYRDERLAVVSEYWDNYLRREDKERWLPVGDSLRVDEER